MKHTQPPSTDLTCILNYYNAGKYQDAENMVKNVLSKFPNNLFCLKMLGIIYGKLDKPIDSLEINQKIISITNNDPEAYNNLGISLKNLGRLKESISSFHKAIEINSNYADAYFNLSNAYENNGNLEEALQANQRAVDLGILNIEAYLQLGIKHYQNNNIDKAIGYLKYYLSEDSQNYDAHLNMGDCLSKVNNFKEAKRSYEKALAIKPNSFEVYNNLGNLFTHFGDFKNAILSLEKAISIKPDSSKAHYNLSQLKKYKTQDNQLKHMEKLYLDEKTGQDDTCLLAFALSKAYEDINMIEQAYSYYKIGNSIRKKQLAYHQKKDLDLFHQIKKTYEDIQKLTLRNNYKKSNVVPIFIIGMPRSGTTLVEQILSSHDNVQAGGELNFISKHAKQIVLNNAEITTQSLSEFRCNYIRDLEKISNNKTMIVDKMFNNFLYLGLITIAFPEAKVIHISRDPAATCWSIFTKCFPLENQDLAYSYSIEDIINYYNQYTDLMNLFRESQSDRIYELDYESLVSDKEDQIMKLIKYLDLKWDDKCLSPESNTRAVYTASNQQVRQKIYKNSSKNWIKYKPFIGNLLDNLHKA